MSEFTKKHLNVRNLTLLAVLIALEVILSRFLSIQLWNMKFGFAFIALVLAARIMGPVEAMIVGGLSDLIGAILFPSGAFFPGFTLTAILTGLCYALFIHKRCDLKRIIGCVLINQLMGSLLLNSLWISILYSTPYGAQIIARLPQVLIMSLIHIAVMELIFTKGNRLITALSTN